LEDNTVTIRDRDTMQQDRVAVGDLPRILAEKASWRAVLNAL
jgi:glycyl-tRNA synthetase